MNSITINTDIINIVISGVGGQGVLTLAEILAKAALAEVFPLDIVEPLVWRVEGH